MFATARQTTSQHSLPGGWACAQSPRPRFTLFTNQRRRFLYSHGYQRASSRLLQCVRLMTVIDAICSGLGMELVGEVGHGAFKRTFEAKDPSGQRYAVKLFNRSTL